MISIGLIGAGRIASVHARHLQNHPFARIVAVADPLSTRAAAIAAQHNARVLPNAEAIIAADDIDAVIIASSTETHCPLMLAAVRAGKKVYCEKPLASTLAEAGNTLRELGEGQHQVMVGFNRRFDRNHAAIQADIAQGRLGRLQTVQITSRGPNAVPSLAYLRVSGGLFYDKMIHFFDLARWLTGEEITEVSAFGSVIADPVFLEANDVDTAMVTLRTASGALCQIDNARRAVYGYDDRIEVFGTAGLAESSRITEGSVMRIFDDKVLTEGLPKDPMIRMAPSYAAAIRTFAQFVRDFGTPKAMAVPGVYDGLRAQIMAEAATRAAAERRIVALEEVEAEIGSL
ncbi:MULTISPECIES: Gfo/Idh/MocA family oxidoreductase [unclassified Brenneria]|uniref:Gfo/Idh/MocA family oxidoreductase n=1 Tax=unclassified Brenneria TaxID=2634434 RepID=UPI0029C45CA1|nr:MULTISPECIES: Gfo/Idh/MocA family oxidoreductase [unclassified Brenneria]MDX5627470.1 Gfo/Idh/MocA family oxidoreductase [Brenneria sp. L3-3Z]MDX5694374.1 Gfo/Idh/MocA family oxidoreductase [Brenneria sp. L4-2C]MEE3662003.1 Gfo/Idh/MocA family oxidoreductase [Brenneria sp. g21c3]